MTAVGTARPVGRGPQPFAVARAALSEALRRKVVIVGLVVSAAFVALFWVGYAFLNGQTAGAEPEIVALAGNAQTVLGLHAVQFLAAFLAVMLSVAAVAPEVDSGAIHAVLARPMSRGRWLLERWAAVLVVAALYTAGMAGAVLLVARLVSGYQPLSVGRALLLLVAETVVLAALGLAASTRFSSVAGGAGVIALFGLAWMGGILDFVGDAVGNPTLERIGVGVSLLVPSDALWRGASYYIQSPSFLALDALGPGASLPFAGDAPPSPWLLGWAALYVLALVWLAHRRLATRDL
jgi:ABC-type transport system involved in multi-copper enzyme maturation permease subunit